MPHKYTQIKHICWIIHHFSLYLGFRRKFLVRGLVNCVKECFPHSFKVNDEMWVFYNVVKMFENSKYKPTTISAIKRPWSDD